MIIKVISDLHISLKSKTNDFLVDDYNFITYLHKICGEANLVVINGDLFELLQTFLWKRDAVYFRQIVKQKQNLINVLNYYILMGKIVYISGNHDEMVLLKNLMPCTERHIVEHHGVRVLFEHGHKYDKAYNKYRFTAWLGGYFERFINKDIDLILLELGKKLNININDDDMYKYAKMLKGMYNADMVVLGHSHNPMIKVDGKFWYVNTGRGCDRKNQLDETTINILPNEFGAITKTITI